MNMLRQFNDAIAYIESNLLHDIDYRQMARIAGCSEYHFRRMFSFLAGMSLADYIRRRKLSRAAELLQSSDIKIIDLALQLGYESPEAFSKAFQALHGVLPSHAKKNNTMLKMVSPLSFQLTIRGGKEMNYRLVVKEPFFVVGYKKTITLQFEGVNPQLNELYSRLTPEVIAELKALSNIEPNGIVNVSTNFTDRTIEGSELDQYIGVATTTERSDRFDVLPVAASLWAVFEVIGPFPQALQDTWANIYAQWFPSSGYELTGGPEMLWNESPDTSKPNYRSEIWIPVRSIES